MKKLEICDVRVGDAVRWDSAAGVIRGTITKAFLGPNANGELIPWYFVRDLDGIDTTICGLSGNLSKLKFKIVARDGVLFQEKKVA